MEITLGGRALSTPDKIDPVLSLLLWGMAGCGKTSLASTAPGVKLWIQFDPGGALSLSGRDDILILDLSADNHIQMFEKFKQTSPYSLDAFLNEHKEIETIVVDSATTLAIKATENAVHGVKSATVENPGLKGYGHRNSLVLMVIIKLFQLANKHNRHFICISHEDTPVIDENGATMFITTALGGKMTNQLGIQFHEIWHMLDTGRERRIAIRPIRQLRPMKSRMFTGSEEFVWRNDLKDWNKGDGIKTWIEKWKENKGGKISTPK